MLFTFLLITLAVVGLIVLFFYYQLRCPPGLENLPAPENFPRWIWTIVSGVPVDKRRAAFPKLLSHKMFRSWFLGKTEIVVSDPDLAKEIYTNIELFPKHLHAEKMNWTLSSQFFGMNVVFSNGDVWKRQHKIVNPAFQTKNLVKLTQKVFSDCARILCEEFEKVDSKPVDIHEWTQRFTLDALGKAGFSYDLGSLRDKNATYVVVYNEIVSRLFTPFQLLLPWNNLLPLKSNTHIRDLISKFDGLLYEIINARIEKKNKQQQEGIKAKDEEATDLLDLMCQSLDDTTGSQQSLTSKELRDNMVVFFLAGHDTTATSLAVACHFLAKYPEYQEKARKEVTDIFNNTETNKQADIFNWIPNFEEQKQMEFLTAVVKESLRLYPSITNLPFRYASKETEFGGFKIPKGSIMTVNIFNMQRRPEVWGPDADDFIPERFLPAGHPLVAQTTKKFTTNSNPYAFNAFGASTRVCMGMNFSFIEQRMFLAALLLRYDLLLAPGFEELKFEPGPLLAPKDCFISLKRRF